MIGPISVIHRAHANMPGLKNESRLMMIFEPAEAFAKLPGAHVSSADIFFGYTIWLLICPPVFLWVGGYLFGWHIGGSDPLRLPIPALTISSILYCAALIFGFFSTVFLSCWMAKSYDADASPGTHIALISIVGTPLAIISAIHLFPHIAVNMLAIIIAISWSMYLLYTGLPVALNTTPEKGMLMSSSLVGWLLVAAVSLLGMTLMVWVSGYGPLLGV